MEDKHYKEFEDQDQSDSEDFQQNDQEIDEDDILDQDYILHEEVRTTWDMIKYSIQDSTEITNHIVVCGLHPSIYYFLLPLRAKYLKDFFLQWIIILNPNHPGDEIMDTISHFPKVYYIKGNPLLQEDLLRANIEAADKAVILGHDPKDMQDEMQDAEVIFIYKAIKKANKNIQIITELVYSSNIEFLLPKDQKPDQDAKSYEETPLFAAGEVYISSTIDTLTCQAYYNPHIVTILQQLLTSGNSASKNVRSICDKLGLKQSNLWQIAVPEDYINLTYQDLFQYLVTDRNLIPLGLYRMEGAKDNKHPFVYTNPLKQTKLTHKDKVFVLGCEMHEDLLTGSSTIQAEGGISTSDIKARFKKQNSQEKLTSNKKSELTRSQVKQKQSLQANAKGYEEDRVTQATMHMFEKVSEELTLLESEIQVIQKDVQKQDEQIVEKIRGSLRAELNRLTQ